jgi:molybdopterin synthase sulfur carrier subunit
MPKPRIVVRLPPVLRPCAAGLREVEARGKTVGEALADLVEGHPGLKWQIFSGENGFDSGPLVLNRYVNVYRNDEEVRVLDGLDTLVNEGDSITLLPAMSGG